MSSPNAFAGSGLDRAAERRNDEGWLEAALAGADARVVLGTPDLVTVAAGGRAAGRLPLAALDGIVVADEPILLGVEGSAPLFAVDVGEALPADLDARLAAGKTLPADLDAGLAGAGVVLTGLRDAVLRLPPGEAGVLAYAQAMLSWQRRHRFCGVCGTRTASIEGGHARRCPSCGAMNHPRTDPVIIVVVVDSAADRILLGRQATWPKGRFSALAGFVEPAESLEDAVAREAMEEAGVAVRDVRYRSSQPWPFPGSLMLGFQAEWAGGDAYPRDGELEDARWFSRAEVLDAAREDVAWDEEDGARLLLPPSVAIARRLVDGWLAER